MDHKTVLCERAGWTQLTSIPIIIGDLPLLLQLALSSESRQSSTRTMWLVYYCGEAKRVLIEHGEPCFWKPYKYINFQTQYFSVAVPQKTIAVRE
jgi:hypothetical protein